MMYNLFLKKSKRVLAFFFAIVALALITPSMSVHALTADRQRSIINGTPWYLKSISLCQGEQSTGILTGSSPEEQTWNFLTGKGLTAEQAAGVMGNLEVESAGFDTNAVEFGNGIGFGLAQWSFGRRTALEAAAAATGKQPGDLAFQLEYLYEELNLRSIDRSEYRGMGSSEWEGLTKQTTVDDALVFFHHEFEISYLIDQPDPRQAVIDNRGGITTPDGYRGAQFFFDTYGGQSCNTAAGTFVVPFESPARLNAQNLYSASLAGYYAFHKGSDYMGGGKVLSIADGEVLSIDPTNYGNGPNNVVKIKHAEGLISSYWHMYRNDILVNPGDTVTAGQQIGVMGNSGNSAGTHLHLEIVVDQLEDSAKEKYAEFPTNDTKGRTTINPDEFLRKYASNYPS